MDNIPAVTVRVDKHGALVDVHIEGQSEPTQLEATQRSEPIAPFGDEEFKQRVRPWAAGG